MGENDIKAKEITAFDKYQLIVKARNFHYENFNKWMTYFYVAIGALFVGYCNLLSSKNHEELDLNKLQYLIPLLGFVISLLWYWASKGYYYWNINFITLVNHYEKDILKFPETERVYYVFANKNEQNDYFSPVSGANISTSKIAILFAFIITNVWGALFFYKCISSFYSICTCDSLIIFSAIVVSIITTILLSVILPRFILKSKIEHFPDLEIKPKTWVKKDIE